MRDWNPEKRVSVKEIKGVNKSTFEVYARLPNQTRYRQRFNNVQEAIQKAEDLKIEGLNLITNISQNLRPSAISAIDEGEYLNAKRILETRLPEWSLLQAVQFAVDRYESH